MTQLQKTRGKVCRYVLFLYFALQLFCIPKPELCQQKSIGVTPVSHGVETVGTIDKTRRKISNLHSYLKPTTPQGRNPSCQVKAMSYVTRISASVIVYIDTQCKHQCSSYVFVIRKLLWKSKNSRCNDLRGNAFTLKMLQS